MKAEVITGDALVEMPKLIKSGVIVDLCATDPPYGIGYNSGGKKKDPSKNRFLGVTIAGDDKPFDPAHLLKYRKLILFGANHYADKLPPASCWLVWDKRCGISANAFGDAEMAWTNLSGPVRIFRHLWDGFNKASERGISRLHPTQKPVELMRWCIERADLPEGATVIDPYCGSGSTGVAAVQMGYNFIGIEVDPYYCAVARARIKRAQGISCDLPRRVAPERDYPLFAVNE